MNNSEFFVYCIQLVVIVFGFVYFEKKYRFLPISIFLSLSLLLGSIVLAMLSAKVAELDSRKYLKDAILLTSFLDKDSSLYGLFFLTGGNGLYPQSYFPMLIASNTWSNYTSYTIEKFYLFFALISKPNLYNISLYFGTLSFFSKTLLLKTLFHLDKNPVKLKLLCFFLMFGGLELYFVSGVYKENLLFLFVSFIFFSLFTKPKTWKYILAFLCFIHAVFIRLDTMVIMMLTGIGIYLLTEFKELEWKRYVLAFILPLISIICLYFSPYSDYVLRKLTRYSKLKMGNTHFDLIDWTTSYDVLFVQVLNRWKQAIFTLFTNLDYLWIVNLSGAITICFIIILLLNQSKLWHKLSLFTSINFAAFILIISLFVPNYMALLRYRSPLLILFILGLILNLDSRSRVLKIAGRL